MGLRERLLDYIAYKGIDKATLERKSGLSNDAVNKMGDNTRVSTLDRISNAYPDINIAWLKTGVGEMICNCNIGFIVGFSILLQRYSFIVYFPNKYVKRNVQT